MVKKYFFYLSDNKLVFSKLVKEDKMNKAYDDAKQMYPKREIDIGFIEYKGREVLSMDPPKKTMWDPMGVLP